MPNATPLHNAVYVQELARRLLAQGFSEAGIFAGTGISPGIIDEDKPFVPFDAIANFYEHAADLTGNETLGFECGARREMRRSGLICYVGLSSPSVRDFIVNLARYRRVFTDAVEIDVHSNQF